MNYRNVSAGALGFVVCCGLVSAVSASTDGELDQTFGVNGAIMTRVGGQNTSASTVALQSDGKIVLAGGVESGQGHSDSMVMRYNSDGSLDVSFDQDGITTTDIGFADNSASAIGIQIDGRIVVTGNLTNGGNTTVFLMRYNSDGSLDMSFDQDGISTTNVGNGSSASPPSLALQSDGKLIVVGTIDDGNDSRVFVLRYNSDGSLDTSLDQDGIVISSVAAGSAYAYDVAIQNDNKIVLAGSAIVGQHRSFAVLRYNSDGSLDTSFDQDGIAVTDVGASDDAAYSIALQGDGKIVVAGSSDWLQGRDFAVVRYMSDGSLDTSFDQDGKARPGVGSGDAAALSVVIQVDGKIVLAGFSNTANAEQVVLVRYGSAGNLDTSFGVSGAVVTSIGTFAIGEDAELQSDGKLIVVGYRSANSQQSALIIRVRAQSVSSNGTSEIQNTTALVARATATSAPTSVSYRAANKSVSLRWDAVSGAASYVVTTTSGTQVCATTTASCVVNKLRNGRAYNYLVYSVNADGVRSTAGTSVSARPGFQVKTTTLATKKSASLSSIVTTPSQGKKSWKVTSGACRISNSRLVAPTKKGSCKLQLSTTKSGSYAAMSTTITVSVR